MNAAALGEHRWGAAQGLDTFIYLTIGTGIGGGGMINGKLMHGLLHPEMGHIRIPHDVAADPYREDAHRTATAWRGSPGSGNGGPLGGESLGTARRIPRLGFGGELPGIGTGELDFQHFAPEDHIGGRRDEAGGLFPKVRIRVNELINGYLQAPKIVPPGLGGRAGILGSLALAMHS